MPGRIHQFDLHIVEASIAKHDGGEHLQIRVAVQTTAYDRLLPSWRRGGPLTGVRAARAGFYVALNAAVTGDSISMREVWSQADDITL